MECVKNIKDWMTSNFLQLNSDKTVILLIGPKNSTQDLLDYNLQLDGCTVTSSTVKNLGVILDSNLSVMKFVGRKRTRLARGDSGDLLVFENKLKQVRTLRILGTSTLSVVSAFTLCVRSGCLPLTVHAAESPLRLSPNSRSAVALSGLSTPITAIRHRCSSFCT